MTASSKPRYEACLLPTERFNDVVNKYVEMTVDEILETQRNNVGLCRLFDNVWPIDDSQPFKQVHMCLGIENRETAKWDIIIRSRYFHDFIDFLIDFMTLSIEKRGQRPMILISHNLRGNLDIITELDKHGLIHPEYVAYHRRVEHGHLTCTPTDFFIPAVHGHYSPTGTHFVSDAQHWYYPREYERIQRYNDQFELPICTLL